MYSLDKLLVVARDAALFYEYNYQPVVEEYRNKRRLTNLQSERAAKGKRRKGALGGGSPFSDPPPPPLLPSWPKNPFSPPPAPVKHSPGQGFQEAMSSSVQNNSNGRNPFHPGFFFLHLW